MKKLLCSFAIILAGITAAQSGNVGINTATPQATLDINGNAIIRTVAEVTAMTADHRILIRDRSVAGDNVIREVSAANLVSGNSGVAYSAAKTGTWSLLNVGLGGSNYPINLTGSDTRIGSAASFSNGVYTAPAAGIYKINFDLQLSGVDITVLSGKSLVIYKNSAVWETKPYDGVRVQIGAFPVATVPITSTAINTLIQLNAGDTVTFAINTAGILPVTVGVLPVRYTSLHIFKVAD